MWNHCSCLWIKPLNLHNLLRRTNVKLDTVTTRHYGTWGSGICPKLIWEMLIGGSNKEQHTHKKHVIGLNSFKKDKTHLRRAYQAYCAAERGEVWKEKQLSTMEQQHYVIILGYILGDIFPVSQLVHFNNVQMTRQTIPNYTYPQIAKPILPKQSISEFRVAIQERISAIEKK